MECPECGYVLDQFNASECPRCARIKAKASPALQSRLPQAGMGAALPTSPSPGAQHVAGKRQSKTLALGLGLGGGAVLLIIAFVLIVHLTASREISNGTVQTPIPYHFTPPRGTPSGSVTTPMPSDHSAGDSPDADALTRRNPKHDLINLGTVSVAIVEDHAEKQGNAWVIAGKLRNVQHNAGKVYVQYDFYGKTGNILGHADTPSLDLNAGDEGSFQIPVPYKEACQYDNSDIGGFTGDPMARQ